MINWIKESGVKVQTNDHDANIKAAVNAGWKQDKPEQDKSVNTKKGK